MRAAGAVTLLLAGIATTNRLLESGLETVGAATAGLNAVADETFARHGGARPGVPAGGLSAVFAGHRTRSRARWTCSSGRWV